MEYDPLSVFGGRISDINKLREELGTKPKELQEKDTVYHRGGEAITVDLVVPGQEHLPNYYAGMFVKFINV